MKRAVSISLGSSKRDKSIEVELLGEQVRIERIGTDDAVVSIVHQTGRRHARYDRLPTSLKPLTP